MIKSNERKFDLFVSDYDGTLGKAPNFIDQENIKAINKYVEEGGIFAICTGRMFCSIRPICIKYGLKGIVISYQGGMINDIETGESLLSGGLDVDLATDIAEYMLKYKITTLADIDDVMYLSEKTEYSNFYEKACCVTGVEVGDLIAHIKKTNRRVVKVGGICNPELATVITDGINEKYGDRVVANNGAPMLVEVINKRFGKKFAVEYLAKYYNVPLDRVIAVGDSTNDLELLNGEWHGVAVGDAREELKKIAKEITVPFERNPIKVLLEKYCLHSK